MQKKKMDEYDLAALRLSRDHRDREKEAEAVGGFLPSPPMLIHEVAKLSDIAYRQSAAPLRHSRRQILSFLARQDGATQGQLSAFSHLTAATVSVELSEMEKEGLVLRQKDEKDLRAIRVFLTERGRELLTQVRESLLLRDGTMMAGFSPEETDLLRRMLTRVRENLIESLLEKEGGKENEP